MKKKIRKKLTLAKETVVQLQPPSDLAGVVGGGSGMDTCSCNCTGDCVTYWGPPCGPVHTDP